MKYRDDECTDGGARKRHIRYEMERAEGRVMPVEPRRALAVLRALDLGKNPVGAGQLLDFAGVTPRRSEGAMIVSRAECQAVARALRGAGYPLDDDGIARFKRERGYSNVIRISPDVAAAYARHASGVEAQLRVAPPELQRMSTEARRALRVLLLMGRTPQLLAKVRMSLGLTDREPARDRMIPVGKISARRLLDWGADHGISFCDDGLKKIRAALSANGSRIVFRKLDALAEPLARWILASDEPPHDYARMAAPSGDGCSLLNRRTVIMLGEAERLIGFRGSIRVARGSYEGGDDDRGAHPHQNGGAVDLELTGPSSEALGRAIVALRQAGFAAWFRDRPGYPHIHAVAIGDREMAAAAEWQIKAYFQGRDGRSRCAADPHGETRIRLPHWVIKYGVRYQSP